MPVIQLKQSVAANSISNNLLAGNINEFVHEDSIIRVYATAGAAGLNLTLMVGDEIVVDDVEVNSQNRMPLVPDDLLVEAGAFAGDRLVAKFRNTTGSAITGYLRIDIEPV